MKYTKPSNKSQGTWNVAFEERCHAQELLSCPSLYQKPTCLHGLHVQELQNERKRQNFRAESCSETVPYLMV